MAEASVDRSTPPEWKNKRFQENVIFPEVMEKASKKIEKKCYSSRKELENE